jgi:farnesyl-diphosphate farnesyltransferase
MKICTMSKHDLSSGFAEKRDIWLKEVSRTFYPSIKALPKDLSVYVGHSYLICRFLDTIEDAYDITVANKIKALDAAIDCINDPAALSGTDNIFNDIADRSDIKPYEKVILKNAPDIFFCINTFPADVQAHIRKWTVEMAVGMKKYAFGADNIKVQLSSVNELEEYTYYVAGTVGELLSELFTLTHFKVPQKSKDIMRQNGVSFGKALQYVNIIKDSREDFTEGRCFIPKELLDKHSISLDEFFKNEKKDQIKAVYQDLIEKAEQHMDSAMKYIEEIPVRLWRIRLFCIWPVALAYATLNGIKKDLAQFIDTNNTYKISRAEVGSILKRGYIAAFSRLYFKSLIK